MTTYQVQLPIRMALFAALAMLPLTLPAQDSLPDTPRTNAPASPQTPAPSSFNASPAISVEGLTYRRPTQSEMFRNYAFDAFGPYPIATSLLMAGIDQETNSPPEWHQGMRGYGRRFGSEFGTAVVSTTAHFALAQAFKEDTLYYRGECTGFFPRATHALVSTLTARHGNSKRPVFSVSALAAPYAGPMTAVYVWYPDRFGAKDALRMGTYNLLAYAGANISLEFRPAGAHSWLHRLHLDNTHGITDSGSEK